MEGYATSKYNRISVKKLKRVSKSFYGMGYEKAIRILEHLPQKGAYLLRKTLKSAASNLINQGGVQVKEKDFVIKKIILNQGTMLKRVRPRARGRADRICKPTSHIKVVLWSGEEEEENE